MNVVRNFCITLVLILFCMTANAAAPMKVMVTVDVESYTHGDPDKQIWGKQPDGEHGIRRIMDILDKHGLKGTFYLNVYEAAKHGEPRIAEVARAIHQRGHDLQLHTHPAPMFGFGNMQDADFSHQVEILMRGKDLIRKWTGKTVVAHRAGAFAANLDTIRATRASGLTIDSSFSPALSYTMLSRQLPASNLPKIVDGILELPVSYYTQPSLGGWHSLRILDIEASSLDEFKSVVRQFRDEGAPFVNILMHSFSFVRFGPTNPEMERRFDLLLEFLTKEPGLEVVTVSQLSPAWISQVNTLKGGTGPVPYTGLWMIYGRATEEASEGGVNLVVAVAPAIAVIIGYVFFVVWRRSTRSKKTSL